MNIIYIGSSGTLSLTPLLSLLGTSHCIKAIIVDNCVSDIPVKITDTDSIEFLAFDNNIPLIYLDENFSLSQQKFSSLQADIIIVSCYPRKLPEKIIEIPKLGGINIHPSILPLYRGPTPLFWQFRDGVNKFGVSIHRMTKEFDQGALLSQQIVKIDDGISMSELSQLLAKLAAQLLLQTLDDLELNKLDEVKQDELKATYYSFPQSSDFAFNTSWEAQRIYNFIIGAQRKDRVFFCELNHVTYRIISVYSYQTEPYLEIENEDHKVLGDSLFIKCKEGYVKCKLAKS